MVTATTRRRVTVALAVIVRRGGPGEFPHVNRAAAVAVWIVPGRQGAAGVGGADQAGDLAAGRYPDVAVHATARGGTLVIAYRVDIIDTA